MSEGSMCDTIRVTGATLPDNNLYTTTKSLDTYTGGTLTTIANKWTELPSLVKSGLIVYAACATFGFMISTYNDGKEELIKRRSDRNKNPINDDWISVKSACKKHIFTNFINSIIFPYTIVSSIMPSIIMFLNPEPKPKLD